MISAGDLNRPLLTGLAAAAGAGGFAEAGKVTKSMPIRLAIGALGSAAAASIAYGLSKGEKVLRKRRIKKLVNNG